MKSPHRSKTPVTMVVGGGVIGLCCALFASRNGHSITIVDRQPESHPGCSHGNAGMIVPSHFTPLAAPGMVSLALKWMANPRSPFYIKPSLNPQLLKWGLQFWKSATRQHVARSAPLLRDLSLASRNAFVELASTPGCNFGLIEKGLLMLCRTERALLEENHTAEQARSLGIPATQLDPEQTARLDPGVRMNIAGAIHFPKDCHLDPARFLTALKQELRERQTRFLWNTEVLGWETRGNQITAATTTSGPIPADHVILCGGSWTTNRAADLGLNLPLQAGKGYSLTLEHPRERPALCSILTEARIAVTPIGNNLRFGGTMEIAGLQETINPARIEGILENIPGYYPSFKKTDFDGIKPWCGLRPCSPDGLPYLGRIPGFNNALVATGHAMMGLSLAPVTGQIISRLLDDQEPGFDLSLLKPNRFS